MGHQPMAGGIRVAQACAACVVLAGNDIGSPEGQAGAAAASSGRRFFLSCVR